MLMKRVLIIQRENHALNVVIGKVVIDLCFINKKPDKHFIEQDAMINTFSGNWSCGSYGRSGI